MKTLIKITVIIMAIFQYACAVKIKNAKTETVKVYGNCNMCKSTIESAAYQKKISKAVWDQDKKLAMLTYDSIKTTYDIILKKIALSGYDNERFLAPSDVYAKLHGCCQYERKALTPPKVDIITKTDSSIVDKKENPKDTVVVKEEISQLKAVFDKYFVLKDALVKTDGNLASTAAKELSTTLNAVKMEKLGTEEHIVWMKVMKNLAFDAEHIADTKDASHQRDHFMTLSKNMYELMKVSKTETPTYYQFCPMANDGKGANWLSKENTIKNPYYGSQMLTCGKTVETLK